MSFDMLTAYDGSDEEEEEDDDDDSDDVGVECIVCTVECSGRHGRAGHKEVAGDQVMNQRKVKRQMVWVSTGMLSEWRLGSEPMWRQPAIWRGEAKVVGASQYQVARPGVMSWQGSLGMFRGQRPQSFLPLVPQSGFCFRIQGAVDCFARPLFICILFVVVVIDPRARL